MNIDKELFIFGEPVETEIGLIRFLTYKEYLINVSHLSAMKMNVLHIYYHFRKMIDPKDTDALAELDELKKAKLLDLVLKIKEFANAYMTVFGLVLDMNEAELADASLERLFDDEELFIKIRKLVLDMNMMAEDEINENPEVQAFIEKSQRQKQKDGEKQTFSDIISSVVVGSPHSYEEVANMTVLQLYSTFYRISQFQNYKTSTLFATVAEKVQIESWNKHIDLFEKSSSGISASEFNKTYGGMFK